MPGTTGSARQEAERLVATVLAMAAQHGLTGAERSPGDSHSGTAGRVAEGFTLLGDTVSGLLGQLAGPAPAPGSRTGGAAQPGSAAPSDSGHHEGGWSTGSAECCVCPLCRVIATMRDPSPEVAERLATGAGDFAAGVASLLRAFSSMSAPRPPAPRRGDAADAPQPDPDTAWSAATRAPRPAEPERTTRTARPAEQERSGSTRTPSPTAGASGVAEAEVGDAWSAATRAAVDRPAPGGTGTRPVPAPVRRAEPGKGSLRPAGRRPRPHDDAWAAATADPEGGVPDMAPSPTVDHDVPGRTASGRAGAGTMPAASAAEDRAAGTGDDARAGAAG
ncbi:hypothetical protein KRMM14A1259_63700 [Krasilnikovia sp. MM14-A1259]